MRLRYQVGQDRFATLEQASAVAVMRYVTGDSYPPQFVFDRATRQPCGLTEFMRHIGLMQDKLVPDMAIPTFTDAAGDIHMGIKA